MERTTIEATIDMKAYKEWYQTNARCGVWLLDARMTVALVSEPYKFGEDGEEYRTVSWKSRAWVSASVPTRFITVKS